MTDPKNTEDQELTLDQLKDAAGGVVVDPKTGDKLKDVIITSITVDPKTGDKRSTSPKSNVNGTIGYE